MPIYEYDCTACGQHTEIMQKISDPEATVCPHCQKPALKRLVSAAGFQLKGTGWYVTDFRNKEKPGTEKTNTDAPTEKTTHTTETKTQSSTDTTAKPTTKEKKEK